MEDGSLGQVNTPHPIATAICRWAIRLRPDGSVPRVLDPAVGPGTFAVAAADRLAALGAEKPLNRILAVDVDPEALAGAESALADRAGALTTVRDSFLAVAPTSDAPAAGPAPPTIGRFDAVVGNPPYLRQEAIDTTHYRAHLDAFGPTDETPYRDGPRAIDRRSDAYVYFLTHATAFLKDGGRLGFVVPTKWLNSRYGQSLQQFLVDHYRLEAVVGFEARAFEDVLVDAAVLCCERRSNEADRGTTSVRFIRVHDRVSAGTLTQAIDADVSVPTDERMVVVRNGSHRLVAVRQTDLAHAGSGKLAPHLRAPAPLVHLVEHPDLVPLSELAAIHRGVTTGANEFFLLDAEQAHGIDERFLQPAVRSLRSVEGRVTRSPPEHYLFDVHDYVTSIEVATERSDGDSDRRAQVTAALRDDGYVGALRHIAEGERRGYHERRTCAARSVWFDLGSLRAPAILHPKFFDERVVVVHNPDRLVPTNAVDCVSLASDVPEAAALGALNSTVHRALLECWGRTEGGGALQLMTYEVESVPVLDVRTLRPWERQQLAENFRRLIDGDPEAQAALDRAVLDAIGVDMSVDQLQSLHEGMVRRRVDRTVDVLVEHSS